MFIIMKLMKNLFNNLSIAMHLMEDKPSIRMATLR